MNLLPEENKIAYKKFYLKRLFAVFGSLIFFVAISGIIVLTPGLLLIISYKNEINAEIEARSKKSVKLSDSLVAEIKKLNDKAKLVEETLKKRMTPGLIFKNIIAEKNNGIKITFLSYEKGAIDAGVKADEKNEYKIMLSGIATKRDDLILFERQLKKEFGESNIISPVSNLISGKNLDFSISLYVKNEK